MQWCMTLGFIPLTRLTRTDPSGAEHQLNLTRLLAYSLSPWMHYYTNNALCKYQYDVVIPIALNVPTSFSLSPCMDTIMEKQFAMHKYQ